MIYKAYALMIYTACAVMIYKAYALMIYKAYALMIYKAYALMIYTACAVIEMRKKLYISIRYFTQGVRIGISSRAACINCGLMICNSFGIDDIQGIRLDDIHGVRRDRDAKKVVYKHRIFYPRRKDWYLITRSVYQLRHEV